MIRTLVSYDDQDFDLGNYFAQSNITLRQRITNPNVNYNDLNGENCTMQSINQAVSNFPPNNFVFVAFSHGENDDLHTSSDRYVTKENAIGFSNSFFYSSACWCANDLAPSLIENQCHSFIGYKGKVQVHPDYYNEFIDCEIHGIVEFLNTDKTIGESYTSMKEKYLEVIERLSEGNIVDTIIAGILVDNHQLLEILGNEDLKASDFYQE